jgi:hypothetical protein
MGNTCGRSFISVNYPWVRSVVCIVTHIHTHRVRNPRIPVPADRIAISSCSVRTTCLWGGGVSDEDEMTGVDQTPFTTTT